MLSRVHRFHGSAALGVLYRRAKTARGPSMSLKYSPRPAGKPYRLAVVVSRKVSKSAVVRNRIRRRLYEVVRQQTPQPGAYDLLISVFEAQVETLPPKELERAVGQLLKKAGVLAVDSPGPHAIVKGEKDN